MDLSDYRQQIDAIDDQLVRLFAERMTVAAEIAAYKREHNLPVLDAAREQQKLNSVADKAPLIFREDTKMLYEKLFELSRGYQERLLQNK